MNRIRATAVAATLLSAFLVAPTWAQTETPRFDQRQANQEQRIDRATSTGSLTEREAARLEKGQDRLDKMEDKATADGTPVALRLAFLRSDSLAPPLPGA